MTSYAYITKRDNDIDWLQKQLRGLSSQTVDSTYIENDGEHTEFYELCSKLKMNDTLHIFRLEVLEMGLEPRIELVKIIQNLNIRLIVCQDNIDTSATEHATFIDNYLLFMTVELNLEQHLASQRQLMANKPRELGRPRIEKEVVEKIKFYSRVHKLPIRRIAEICEVSIGTVHKYLNS